MLMHLTRSALIALATAAWASAVLAAGPHAPGAPVAGSRSVSAAATLRPIDINSAPLAQLETLPGVDKAQAQRIVAGRPYRSKADLVTTEILPAGIYLSIKHRIVAVQKRPPKSKT